MLNGDGALYKRLKFNFLFMDDTLIVQCKNNSMEGKYGVFF